MKNFKIKFDNNRFTINVKANIAEEARTKAIAWWNKQIGFNKLNPFPNKIKVIEA